MDAPRIRHCSHLICALPLCVLLVGIGPACYADDAEHTAIQLPDSESYVSAVRSGLLQGHRVGTSARAATEIAPSFSVRNGRLILRFRLSSLQSLEPVVVDLQTKPTHADIRLRHVRVEPLMLIKPEGLKPKPESLRHRKGTIGETAPHPTIFSEYYSADLGMLEDVYSETIRMSIRNLAGSRDEHYLYLRLHAPSDEDKRLPGSYIGQRFSTSDGHLTIHITEPRLMPEDRIITAILPFTGPELPSQYLRVGGPYLIQPTKTTKQLIAMHLMYHHGGKRGADSIYRGRSDMTILKLSRSGDSWEAIRTVTARGVSQAKSNDFGTFVIARSTQ